MPKTCQVRRPPPTRFLPLPILIDDRPLGRLGLTIGDFTLFVRFLVTENLERCSERLPIALSHRDRRHRTSTMNNLCMMMARRKPTSVPVPKAIHATERT